MNIRDYAKQNGQTLTQIAEAIGVTHSSVVKYAQGKCIPRPPVMDKIVGLTGGKVTPNDFYSAADSRHQGAE